MTTSGDGGTGQAPGGQNPQQGQAPAAQPNDTGQPQGQGQGQAPAPQQPGQQGQGQEPGQTGTPDLSAIADPNLRAWVEAQARQAAEARQEAARYRTERNALNDQVTQFQRQNETEQQRVAREAQEAQERLQALERENRDLKIGTRFREAATKANALDADALVRLVGLDAVQVDSDGNPSNIADLIQAAQQQYPYLFRRSSTDAGAGAGDGADGASSTSMNDFIRGRGRRATAR
jgi:hypothetical protein